MNSAVHEALAEYVASQTLSERYNSHYCDKARNVWASPSSSYEQDGRALLDCLSAMWDTGPRHSMPCMSYAQIWLATHRVSFVTDMILIPFAGAITWTNTTSRQLQLSVKASW